jgi:DNA polymerase V
MAVDTVQRSTTLDDLLITNPKSTVIFPVRDPAAEQYGPKSGDLLVVDRLAKPRQGQLIIVLINDELSIRRMGAGRVVRCSQRSSLAATEGDGAVWGVVTYAIQKQI